MNARKQIKFDGIIGTNCDNVTYDMMLRKIFEIEVLFNKQNPDMRMHISTGSEDPEGETK